MSALLSSIVNILFCLRYMSNYALQVGSFRDIQQNWMIFGLPPKLQEA